MVDALPLASVIVRSMDPPTLARALDSVAAQDYPAIEVVLVAACGPSHRPIDSSRYPFRLTFVQSGEPLPRPRAANAGLDASHGALITFLDHDDEFLPGHLSGLAGALASHADCGASYCRFEVFEGGTLFTTVGHAFDRLALHEKSYIHHSGLLFRRSLLATGIRYDEALDIHDDWDFVLQLAQHARFVFVEQTTFRWHSDVGTSGGGGVGNFDPVKYTTQRRYVHDKWKNVFAALVDRFNNCVERGMAAAQGGRYDEAQRWLGEALEIDQRDADVLNSLAMLAYRRREFDEADRLLGRALREREGDVRLWFNSGLVSAACGRIGEAGRAFNRVLALQPDHRDAAQWLQRLSA